MLRMNCCPSLQKDTQRLLSTLHYRDTADTMTLHINTPCSSSLPSPVFLSFKQLPISGDLNVQGQFQVHQILQVKKMVVMNS